MNKKNLIIRLKNVAKKAYAPYSNFHVVALLETKNGEFFEGFNIENASYPNSLCAERVALYSYIRDGYKTKDIDAVHIFSPDSVDFLSPCGECRQTLSEWIKPRAIIRMYNKKGEYIEETMEKMLPYFVDAKNIKGEK